MFESVKSFFGNVGTFFSNAYHTVADKVSSVITTTKQGIQYITDIPKSIVTTVYTDTKSVVKGVGDTINHIVDRTSDNVKSVIDGTKSVITNGQNVIGGTVSNVGQSLSFPLVLLGGAGALYMLSKNK